MRRSQTSLARTQEEIVVKYSPINQFLKGFSPSMAVNSYLNNNVEGEQFYFSFGSFLTERSSNIWRVLFHFFFSSVERMLH